MILLPEEAEVTFSHLFFPKVKIRSNEVVTKHDLSTKPGGMWVFAWFCEGYLFWYCFMNVISGSQETDVACPKAKLSQPSGKCAGVHLFSFGVWNPTLILNSWVWDFFNETSGKCSLYQQTEGTFFSCELQQPLNTHLPYAYHNLQHTGLFSSEVAFGTLCEIMATSRWSLLSPSTQDPCCCTNGIFTRAPSTCTREQLWHKYSLLWVNPGPLWISH